MNDASLGIFFYLCVDLNDGCFYVWPFMLCWVQGACSVGGR